MADYKIQLGVLLNTSDINTQIKNIKPSNPIKIDIDTNHTKTQIDAIRKQIQSLSNVKVNLGSNSGGSANINNSVNQMTTAYNKLRNISKNIGAIKVKLSGLDASKDINQINILEQQLKSLTQEYHTTVSKIKNKGDLSSGQWQKVQQQIDNTKIKLEQLNAIMADKTASQKQAQAAKEASQKQAQSINELKKSYQELINMANQISNLEAKIGKLKLAGGNVNQIEVLEAKLKSLKATYDSLANSFVNKGALTSGVFDVGDLSNLNNAVNQGKIKLNELEAEYEDTRVKLARKLEINLQEGKFSAQVAKVNGDAKKLSSVTNELQQKLKALNIAEQSMNTAFKSGSVEQKIQSYNNYKRALESVRNQLKQNQIAEQSATNTVALNQAKQNLSLKMSNWLRDNSAAAKQFGGEIQNLQAQLKKCGNMSAVNNVGKAFNNVILQAKAAGVATQNLGDKIKTQFSKYSSYFSVASVFMYTTRALRSMFNQVKAIDSAMTELKKVTDETDASYNDFLSNAASRAKEIGTTIDGLVSSTADFARLGYNFKDAQGLAEVANIYAVVGDEVEGVEGATESLISTMAAFKDEMNGMSNTDFAMSITDKFNEIGKLIA